MPLLDALQVPTYSRYFKDIMGNKPKKEEEPNKKEVKKEKDVVASIATKKIAAPVRIKARSPPMKTKKTTKPEDKPAPRGVRKWVPKTAAPSPSVGPK